MTTTRRAVRSTASPDRVDELARRQLGRVDLSDANPPGVDVRLPSGRPGRRRAPRACDGLSSNSEDAPRAPRAAAATAYWIAIVDLPVPAGPISSVLVPRSEPAAEERVERGDAARQDGVDSSPWCSAATSRGKTSSPPGAMHEVVVAAAVLRPADT